MSTQRDDQKLSGVEFLRFASAFAVLVAHYNHFYVYKYASENFTIEAQPLFRLFSPFYRYGTRAVEVFWCLSGFVFFFRYADVIRAKAMPPMRFFWLRFSRLYPLHLGTLLVVAILQQAYRARYGAYYLVEINDLKHFVLNLFYASYWGFQDGFSFNAPIWSVSLEVLAYLFFYVATRLFGADFFTTILCLAGCLAVTYFTGNEPVILRCIFYFYLGGLGCLAFRAVSKRMAGRRILLALIPGLGIAAFGMNEFRLTGNLAWVLNLEVPVALVLLAIVSPFIPDTIARTANFLGNLTYASYLIHFPIQLLVMWMVGVLNIDHRFAASPAFLVGYLVAVLALSHAVYRWIEMPAQRRIRERFVPRLSGAEGRAA